MSYFFKYFLFVLSFILLTESSYSQKKHSKIHSSKVSKKPTLKSKKNVKKIKSKRRVRLNNIDKVIFKDNNEQIATVVTTNRLDTVPEKVVSILSAFKPQLKNVAKISFTSAVAQNDTSAIQVSYQVPSQNLSFLYQPVALVPRTYKTYPTQVLRNLATMKVGYGNNLHQLIDINTTLIDDQAHIHTVGINYESSQGALHLQSTRDFGINYLSDLIVNNNNHIQSQVFYQNNQRYRYGLVDDATTLPNSNFDQHFSYFGGAFKWVNSNEKNLFSLIGPTFKVEHFTGTENANNTWFEIYNPLSLKFDNNFKFNFNFSYNYNQYQLPSGNKINNGILKMDPSIEIIKWGASIKMGVSPTIVNGEYTFTPALNYTKRLKDTSITLSAGWNTILLNNQYSLLAITNPWIAAPKEMKVTTQEKKNIALQFNRSKNLQYGFELALNDYRNLPFFNRVLNSAQIGLQYQSIFEYRAIAIELEGYLRYQFSDKLLLQNNFKYIQYNSIRYNDKPWGKLPMELNSSLAWSPNKKWSFDGGVDYWSGAAFTSDKNVAFDAANTFILNAGFSYKFTNLWKLWAKGENLLDKPYQRWAEYPSLGIQLIGGVVYSFHK
jgi:hypothetical protein